MYIYHASTSVFVHSVETNAFIFVCLQMFSSHRSGLVWIQEQYGAQHDGLFGGWPCAVKASTITKDWIKSVHFCWICVCIVCLVKVSIVMKIWIRREYCSAFVFDLFLSKKAKCLWLEPVLGGVICPVRWHPPDEGRKQDFWLTVWKWKWIQESDSLWWSRLYCLFVVFDCLTSVLDKESVDLKVLVQQK